ncbi:MULTISPECIES: hypothetical protein [Lactobacillus]|jgi:hypothetical protein|uniref:Uncharacterized protein n=2 Tax=Lactobacillus gallinarum TaxID=52242 RepID=A0A1Y4W1J7_9LACO|nr:MULTISPECIES: hypothetical protein [Lactobacillus]NMB31171.1 hypothetical protein [Lactobacillus sp.]KRL21400.1 hypothetical protein FC37_GL001486 [Lactobacillus gallinarum DSM 10532 = JCM 2011]MBL1060252.1 hypothetical protein [Lactobacillus sp. A27]MBM6958456.1 hypothetical protein [Lactobacillus gallinarum]MBM6972824.1 hypothetical protein [Lactobacillus gallinarum]
MNNDDLNTNVRTQINPEDEIEHVEKSGYRQVKDLMNTIHGYCMDYTKLSFDFIHDNKDLIKDIVKTGCKTGMVVSIAAASVSIAKALSKNE